MFIFIKMKDKIYTEEEAYDLIREEQEEILNARGIKFTSRQREKTLVNKILESNPEFIEKPKEEATEELKEEVKKGDVICPRCRGNMHYTGGGPSGKDYKCLDCNFGLTQ